MRLSGGGGGGGGGGGVDFKHTENTRRLFKMIHVLAAP